MKTDKPLEPADLAILRQVHAFNTMVVKKLGMPAGTPFLPPIRKHKRARALAAIGLLEIKSEITGLGTSWPTFLMTQAGIDAYNAALATAKVAPAP